MRVLKLLPFALLGSGLAAIAFALRFHGLQLEDDATGQLAFVVFPLGDPVVVGVLSRMALISGLFATLLAYPCLVLRRRNLCTAAWIVIGSVLLWLILATPWLGYGAWLGSYGVLMVSLVCCAFAPLRCLTPRSDTQLQIPSTS
jgi:hypothetical protein